MKKRISTVAALVLAAVSTLYLTSATAHGPEDHKKKPSIKVISKDEHPWGREGDPKNAKRVIQIGMADTMRYDPARIEVKQGETVKFVIKNGGKIMHELVIGTEKDLKAHAEVMKKNPEMEHEEPYMAHVKPAAKEEIVWQFTKPGEFMYACLIPGHFEAGMVGKIVVAAAPKAKSNGHASHKH